MTKMNHCEGKVFWTVLLLWWLVIIPSTGCMGKKKERLGDPCDNLDQLEVNKAIACKGQLLILAVQRDKLDEAESLLNDSSSAHMVRALDKSKFSYDFTALTWAAKKNHLRLVELLIQLGADVKHLSRMNYTALYFLARNRNQKGLDIVLSKGADPNVIPIGENSPLLDAAWNNYYDIAKALLDKGADPNYITPESKYFPLYFASKKGNLDMVKELLKRGAEIDLQTSFNVTGLLAATTNGHDNVVRALLDKNADPNLSDTFGYSPLLKAAHYGYCEILKTLLEKNADIDAVDADDRTALHFSAVGGWKDCVKELWKRCPNDKIKNGDDQTALDEAISTLDKLERNPEKSKSDTDKISIFKSIINKLKGSKSSACR